MLYKVYNLWKFDSLICIICRCKSNLTFSIHTSCMESIFACIRTYIHIPTYTRMYLDTLSCPVLIMCPTLSSLHPNPVHPSIPTSLPTLILPLPLPLAPSTCLYPCPTPCSYSLPLPLALIPTLSYPFPTHCPYQLPYPT